ncbi:MAG: ribose-phosphate pyrophosphokinase [Sphingomonas fennica]
MAPAAPLWQDGAMDEADGAGSIADVPRVRGLLIAAAREGRALSYSEALAALGHRFSRPKMRALCRTLDAIDEAGRAAGEPELAVLVVRESDRLPGQGWWAGGRTFALGHDAPWTGPAAAALVGELQAQAFDWWAER